MSHEDCLFCKIVKRGIPSSIVHEDEFSLAFDDIAPQAPTHILIIPKEHISGIPQVEDKHKEVIGHLVTVARKLAKDKGLEESGYRLVFNSGQDAGQAVFHIHLHLLGGRKMSWPPG